MRLPTPAPGPAACSQWVEECLAGLFTGTPTPSSSFRGGQAAADAALEGLAMRGYAAHRNEVWPVESRGATRLSPYIRHGLLPLPRVWCAAGRGPARDARKLRDELLWQEYARHLYARVGSRSARGLRAEPKPAGRAEAPWPDDMLCVRHAVSELESEGWLPNQSRMWLASQWALRDGHDWRDGEDRFFRHLLDGSRAANRLGWQWTSGAATGRPYLFTRRQVERRAPGLCRRCPRMWTCPIQDPPQVAVERVGPAPPGLRRDSDPAATGGPRRAVTRSQPEAVWITAESLGADDPALEAWPGLPAIFVFDEERLAAWGLDGKRLVFLAECLAELATRRPLELYRGDPARCLEERVLAATFTPVPGWRRLARELDLASVHPWPWLVPPGTGSVASFSAWVRQASLPDPRGGGPAAALSRS